MSGVHYAVGRRTDKPRLWLLAFCVLVLAAGVAVWAPEFLYQRCIWARDGAMQPHALWHCFTALALAGAYGYVRSMGCDEWRDVRVALLLEREVAGQLVPSLKEEGRELGPGGVKI